MDLYEEITDTSWLDEMLDDMKKQKKNAAAATA